MAEDTPHKVIYKLRDLLGVDDMGGTMRLGSYACRLAPDSLAFRLYGEEIIHERHRHRYEFNCLYEQPLVEHGLRVVGRSLDGKFVEIVELPGHPWYLAVQFHPEFKSKPLRPHPLFAGFIEAAYKRKMSLQGVATNVTAIGDRPARPKYRAQGPSLLAAPVRSRSPRTSCSGVPRSCSSPGPASSRARRTPSSSAAPSPTIARAPACPTSSRRRSTRPTARRATRFAAGPRSRAWRRWRACGARSACRS